MAGICLYGPLGEPLYSDAEVRLLHRLESVKILPRKGQNHPPDYGPITIGSMALAETMSPHTPRIYCMAVTAPGDDQWRPTLWSAAIDQAASGVNDGQRRLVVLSAGNLREDVGKDYPVESRFQCRRPLAVVELTNRRWLHKSGVDSGRRIGRLFANCKAWHAFTDQPNFTVLGR